MPSQAVSATNPDDSTFDHDLAEDSLLLPDLNVYKKYTISDAVGRQKRLIATEAPELFLVAA
jgi:hypothetical protein